MSPISKILERDLTIEKEVFKFKVVFSNELFFKKYFFIFTNLSSFSELVSCYLGILFGFERCLNLLFCL
jgi:hypothetical protein